MIYNRFKDTDISMLGFGLMRLPVKEDGTINEELTSDMVDYAMKHGVNYYDTAWPYHNGESELVIGRILQKYPRDSFYLADKYPGHVIADQYDPKDTFEKQLQKCQVEYFDFYLLHNIYENSLKVYEDPQWGIIDYFVEQKRQGRIRHLGFSSHADLPALRNILDKYGKDMEFVQLQVNCFDWTVQKAREKCELAAEYGLPVIIMEPLRGGKLASFPEEYAERLNSLRPGVSAASLSLRWFQGLDNIMTVLSGMSDMDQMIDNIRTFDHRDPLNEAEKTALYDAVESMRDEIPCTSCRYCTEVCPMGLDIPDLIFKYNQLRSGAGMTVGMQIDAIPEDERPQACIECGACMEMCPQKIEIPAELEAFSKALKAVPSWADICRQREDAARKLGY